MESVGTRETDRQFAGSIPETYDRYLGPLLFEPYARDLAARLAALAPARVLETAAGTGVATRALARALPAGAAIVATDLNRPMLDLAAARMETAEVTWQQADALALPFGDGAFDAVACQFGAMFFPDKAAAYREARRVLRRGGRLVLSVWDRIESNELAHVVDEARGGAVPGGPAPVPGPRALRLPRRGRDHRRAAGGRVRGGRGRDGGAARPGALAAARGGRLLPGHAAAGRDRGAGAGPARRSDGRGRACGRGALRRRPGRQRHAGPRHRRDAVSHRCRKGLHAIENEVAERSISAC